MLALAWELALAPLRPGGSWLALKVVPLLLPLPALLRGSTYAMQVALFIVMIYLFEGAARLFEPAPAAVAGRALNSCWPWRSSRPPSSTCVR